MKRFFFFLILIVFAGLLSGCSLLQVEDEILTITVAKSQETTDYEMDVVRMGDILSTQSITCTYSQLNEEYVYFSVDGKKIKAVYVEAGDSVVKGDLLAELETEDLDDKIENLQYTLAKYQLEYKQLLEDKEFELACAEEMYYYTTMKNSDRENTQEELLKIEESYQSAIEDYQDKIYIASRNLEEYQQEKIQACVYAGMSGLVSYVRSNLEGSMSNSENEIILIADDSACAFFSEDIEFKDYFTEGQTVTLTAGYGSKEMTLDLQAVNQKNWTERMQFQLVDKDTVVEFGTRGTFELVLEGKTDVLYIPKDAVHKADEKYYVYTVDEDGMREVRYITIGLIGTESIQVVEGLDEGEIVILR